MNWTKIRQQVLERDDYTCQECYTKIGKLDVHHVIPRDYGGQDTFRNLITLCGSCHHKTEAEYRTPVFNNIIKFKCNPIITGNKIFVIVPKFYHKNLKKFNKIISVTVKGSTKVEAIDE